MPLFVIFPGNQSSTLDDLRIECKIMCDTVQPRIAHLLSSKQRYIAFLPALLCIAQTRVPSLEML